MVLSAIMESGAISLYWKMVVVVPNFDSKGGKGVSLLEHFTTFGYLDWV